MSKEMAFGRAQSNRDWTPVKVSAPPRSAGVDGATSLKERIMERMPEIRNAAQYRQARELLRSDLGGSGALRDELIFAGFVDPRTNMLTSNEKPFNVFARITSGKLRQPGMEKEQEALGSFREKFQICCNQAEHNLHWDSADPKWVGKASMSRRHRFLTSKDLHWQWFNALVFGLVGPEHDGIGVKAALAEVQAMKEAALQYAKDVGGWTEKVGLYVNTFGHNSVNSLFVHIVDLAETGPSFEALAYKNLDLDEVLKVLQEEALTAPVVSPSCPPTEEEEKPISRRSFFFAGTDGATSLKQEITGRIPVLRDAAGYREARRLLLEELGGVESLREELSRAGFVDRETGMLTTGKSPFNIFARVGSGVMEQPGMAQENAALGPFGHRFKICRNLPVNDEHWDSEDPEWVGKSSMSRRHRFLTTRNLDWKWFNALCFGLVDGLEAVRQYSDTEDSRSPASFMKKSAEDAVAESASSSLREAVEEVEAMKAAALTYTKAMGWSSRIGLFFHVFGHNSVNSLHVHIVDMEELGPSYYKMEYKNMPLDNVLKVLKEEAAIATVCQVSSHPNEVLLAARTQSSRMVRKATEIEYSREVLDLNVGGELTLSVSRGTLLLCPQDSLLSHMFCQREGAESVPMTKDSRGRIFLDFPPLPFKRIVDHLRLLRLAPPSRFVPPPTLRAEEEAEFRMLAGILGVEEFIMQTQPGRKNSSHGPEKTRDSSLSYTLTPSPPNT